MTNDLEFSLYTQVKFHLLIFEIFKTTIFHRLSICYMVIEGFVFKKAYETVGYCYPCCISRATLDWHQLEQYWESNKVQFGKDEIIQYY